MEPIKTNFRLNGAIDTRIGGRSENQDYYGYYDTPVGTAVVVCDGMGGMQGGQVASRLAVNTILSYLVHCLEKKDTAKALSEAIRAANNEILRAGAVDSNLKGMGTTVTAAIFTDECATLAYLGDSRIYHLRGHKKLFRTFDHSLVFEMVKNGQLTEEQARLSDQSNIILQALGIYHDVEPCVYKRPYCKGDKFLLCTDGFWGAMPEKDFLSLVTKKVELGYVLDNTASNVNKIGVAKGGQHDNLTAALIEVKCNSKMKEKMNRTAKIIITILSVLLAASLAFNIGNLVKTTKVEINTDEITETAGNLDEKSLEEVKQTNKDIREAEENRKVKLKAKEAEQSENTGSVDPDGEPEE